MGELYGINNPSFVVGIYMHVALVYNRALTDSAVIQIMNQ